MRVRGTPLRAGGGARRQVESGSVAALERPVRLFRNGRNQALRIPRDFELEGSEAILRKEGGRLIVEPVCKGMASSSAA